MRTIYDPYAVLGVARTASEAEIRRAYRKLIINAHPDRAGASMTDMAAEINAAYTALTTHRATVDLDLRDPEGADVDRAPHYYKPPPEPARWPRPADPPTTYAPDSELRHVPSSLSGRGLARDALRYTFADPIGQWVTMGLVVAALLLWGIHVDGFVGGFIYLLAGGSNIVLPFGLAQCLAARRFRGTPISYLLIPAGGFLLWLLPGPIGGASRAVRGIADAFGQLFHGTGDPR